MKRLIINCFFFSNPSTNFFFFNKYQIRNNKEEDDAHDVRYIDRIYLVKNGKWTFLRFFGNLYGFSIQKPKINKKCPGRQVF